MKSTIIRITKSWKGLVAGVVLAGLAGAGCQTLDSGSDSDLQFVPVTSETASKVLYSPALQTLSVLYEDGTGFDFTPVTEDDYSSLMQAANWDEAFKKLSKGKKKKSWF